MRKESIEQKEIEIPNMYVPYKRASKHTKKKWQNRMNKKTHDHSD